MPSSSYAPLADEVNPPFSKSTPAPIVTRSGTITYQQEDERDLGEMPRFTRVDKGKGKERAWDVEQGQQWQGHGQEYLQEEEGSYPPRSSEEEDERRIQANLARLAARDQAERKVRSSRLFARPTSIRPGSTHDSWANGGVPIYGSPNLSVKPPDRELSRSGATSPATPTSPSSTVLLHGNPRQNASTPTLPDQPQPYANPFNQNHHRSSASIQADPGFDYAGPTWRGGAGAGAGAGGGAAAEEGNANGNNNDQGRMRRVLPDKWWKALCAWGADLDGGHDDQEDGGQAGRTNPFE